MPITTVNANLPRVEYTASGGQVDFTVPFEFFADADLKVYQIPSGATPDDTTHLLTLTTHYTVTGAGVSDPGTRKITLVTGATLNDTIIIEGEDEIDRDTAFLSNGDLTIDAMNLELNKLIMLNKQLSMLIQRKTIQFQDSAILDGVDLDMPAPEANKVLSWNATADQLINAAALPASTVSITAFMETLLDDANQAAAQTTLGVPAANNGTLTDPTITRDGQEMYALVTLDTPIKLLDATADSPNWGPLGDSNLTSDQAVMAVLRCQAVIEGAGGGGATQRAGIFISKDLTGTPDWGSGFGGERGHVAAAAYNGNGGAEFSSDQNDITVNLDGSYQFQYATDSDGTPTSVQYYIWLIGYYK